MAARGVKSTRVSQKWPKCIPYGDIADRFAAKCDSERAVAGPPSYTWARNSARGQTSNNGFIGGRKVTSVREVASVTALLAGTLAVSYFTTGRLLRLFGGFDRNDVRTVSAVMCGRGAVGIAIASVARASGILGNVGFAIVIVGTLLSSIVTSILLRRQRV